MPLTSLPTSRPGLRRGLTLIETLLAIVVGLMLLGGTVTTYNQINKSAKFSKAKTMVGTIQTNIQMDKFRLGTPPPTVSATPITGVGTFGVGRNIDSTGKQYWPDSSVSTTLPLDPVTNVLTVMPYTSTASVVALSTGAPTGEWDNPVFGSPGYGNGGWLYDANTGAFRINLSNKTYPEQRPGSW